MSVRLHNTLNVSAKYLYFAVSTTVSLRYKRVTLSGSTDFQISDEQANTKYHL